ncbi:unnamed protein product [Rotaria sordida]|uniref:3CxxC-type domain-containing protein n=1 Tax=Rotaria sordida TaxID=392033 RepID=A0A813QW90_9BILA|nr:unnamed protein product [Rotaria sordida]CAF3710283.1 unnamed protein product [Rotaria sordida]
MVREVSILSSPNYSIDHIATKHAANDGIRLEELPMKDDLTFKHRSSITDDESGFSEAETTSTRSSPIPSLHSEDFELGSNLSDESKKEFCSDMGLIFHAEFQLTFGRYFLPNQWVLMPLGTNGTCRLPSNALCDVEIAKVRFECDSCAHCWTSMRGQISFFYDCESYILYFKLFTQACDHCGDVCTPLWYPEEVCRVMRNVFVIVNKYMYPNLQTSIQTNHHRRFGNPKGQHHGCESCRDGVCVSVAARQLGCKLRADVNGTNPDGAPYDQCCTNEEIRALIIKHKKLNK